MSKIAIKNRELLDDIFRTLVEEVNLYEGLAEAANKKQTAIVENDVVSITKYTGLEQSYVRKGNMLTSKRLDDTSETDENGQKKLNSLTSFMLNNNLQEEQEWAGLENRLGNSLTRIKRINIENSMLLKSSLSFVQDMIQLIYPKKKTEEIYTREGKTTSHKSTIVDCGV